MRFSFRAGAQLQIIAKRATGPAALAADDRLHRTAMNVMGAGPSRCGECWCRAMPVHRLHHPDTPQTVHGIRTVDIFSARRRVENILSAADEIEHAAEIRNSGYAPGDVREPAMIVDLPPGNYTAIVRGVNDTTGVALVEAYDLATGIDSTLGNISTRAFVQTEDNVMIGGFIVGGTQSKRVIVRAIGPSLTQYGVFDTLADPTLELHDGSGALIASNDNWQTTIIGGIITGNQVRDILNSGLAPAQRTESAIIATLPPGNYTAIVRGVNDTIGVALVEVYDLDMRAF